MHSTPVRRRSGRRSATGAFAAGAETWALALNAFAALLISPISWSHHWVWCVPAILTLTVLGWRHRARVSLVAAGAGLVIFAAAPQWWFPSGHDTELHWAVWQQVVGGAYFGYAVAVLVLSAYGNLTPREPSPPPAHAATLGDVATAAAR